MNGIAYTRAWAKPRKQLARKGQSMVEIALVLPILLIMGLGIAEIARGWQSYHAAKLAAEDGAYTANKFNSSGKGEQAITKRLTDAKLSGGSGIISGVYSSGGIILGYRATVTVNFKPFFSGLSLDVPGAGPIALFAGDIPIVYESIYSRKVM